MNAKNKPIRALSIVMFFLGAILGMALFGSIVWANLEASFYFGTAKMADESLKTLKCPTIMTPLDRTAVSAVITNNTEKAIKPLYRVYVSNYIDMSRLVEMRPTISPGETQKVKWDVSSEDMVFGHLVLAKVIQFATFKTPSREGACGTLFLDIPFFTGNQLLVIGILGCLLFMGLGIFFWIRSNKPLIGRSLNLSRAMSSLVVVVAAGLTVGYFGMWSLGIILLAVCILLMAASLNYLGTPQGINRI
jgi:hypothetical protein